MMELNRISIVFLYIALILLITVQHISASYDVRIPPAIIEQPIESKIYRDNTEIVLTCVAGGFPSPLYDWTKNGKPLHAPNINRLSDGSIKIKPLSFLDEGYYQCLAKNEYGVAISRVATLHRAVLDSVEDESTFESPNIKVGEPYTLKCNSTKCFPKATVTWAVATSTVDKYPKFLKTDNRIQIDDEGSLHFANVRMSDTGSGILYKCNIYNPYLDITKGGSYSKLNIIPAPESQQFLKPSLLFSSSSTVVALEGQNTTLRCFFSGSPTPTLSWIKKHGSMPYLRYTTSHSELSIHNVQQSDAGEYQCTGANQIRESIVVTVDVQAAPVFKKAEDRPQNLNKTEGESVTIKCEAYAIPEVKVTWMRNGVELDPEHLPHKYRLSTDNKYLHISNLCKTCSDGSSDIAVIQCNASNVHGYAFAEGYINVLQKTELIEFPTDVHMSADDSSLSANFSCKATSDDGTALEIRWYRVHTEKSVGGAGDERLHNVSNIISIASDGSLLMLTLDQRRDNLYRYVGDYKCVASNGYSSDSSTASLIIHGVTTTEPRKLPPIMDYWWIFLLVAIILSVLILLLCLRICLHRNKGDSYLVAKKEINGGRDPQIDLEEERFRAYTRPDENLGSHLSMNSSIKMDSDDEGSLNQYGDADVGKFTEDGSFIGTYGGINSKLIPNGHHV